MNRVDSHTGRTTAMVMSLPDDAYSIVVVPTQQEAARVREMIVSLRCGLIRLVTLRVVATGADVVTAFHGYRGFRVFFDHTFDELAPRNVRIMAREAAEHMSVGA